MKKLLTFLFVLLYTANSFAQWVMIDQQGNNPDNTAALEISVADRGLLVPRMTIAQRELISNPAEGLMVYQTDSIRGVYFFSDTEWKILGKNSIINNEVATQIAVVRDVKGSGVNGGPFTQGSWQIRDLNDLRGDSSFITIDGVNTFTLDSGLYEVSAIAPARDVEEHQLRLYNLTDAVSVALGASMRSELADPPAELITTFRISGTTTFRIEHRCTATNNSTVARGSGVNWGQNVYTQVRIQKL
jgi:hypothetical protein